MNKNNMKYILGILISSVMTCSIAATTDIQEGYNYQSIKINKLLEEKSSELYQTYNFEKMSENGKLVPSLVCEEDYQQYYNGIKLKKSEVCNIKYKARSLYKNETTKEILTWRDFLVMPVDKEVVTYKNNAEFKQGIEKANQKALENITTINEMYKGMILYKSLVAEGLMSDSNNTMVKIESNNDKIQEEKND